MAPIGPTRFLLAEIRARAVALRRQPAARSAARQAGERPAPAPETPADWSTTVARAVAVIAPDDPDRNRKAFRAYLRAVLARDLGIRRSEDPSFQALVDQVQDAMEADPRVRRSIQEAGRLLLDGADDR